MAEFCLSCGWSQTGWRKGHDCDTFLALSDAEKAQNKATAYEELRVRVAAMHARAAACPKCQEAKSATV
jgi:hypothetical protein